VSSLAILPLTKERLEALAGWWSGRVTGYAIERDGELVAAIGLVREWWWLRMFAEIKPGTARARGAYAALVVARELLKVADRTVYAKADPNEPRAIRTLLWLGFEPLPLGFFRYRRR
jgi:hypothetical protein